MMTEYYQQSMRALQLAGMSDSTQKTYTRSIRMLVDFYKKAPELITEKELQDYFLHRKNVDKWSSTTLRICYSGIKFFFINVLKRKWHTLELINAKREQRLPDVLSINEVRAIINAVTTPQNKAYLTFITLSPAAHCLQKTANGTPLRKPTLLRSKRFPRSTRPNSSMK